MIQLEIYTDGACNQTTNTGGWSFIILENGIHKISKSGVIENTTNNQSEMRAAIHALNEIEALGYTEPISISLLSDSAYLVNAFVCGWIPNWQKNGWLNSEKKPVLNKELWEELIILQAKTKAKFIQIRRRSNEYAKRVDDMAKKPSLT